MTLSDATFAEKFYSLKRITINSRVLNANLRLTTKQRCWSLIFCVLFPYFRNKMKTMVENIENGEEYKNSVKFIYPRRIWFCKGFKTTYKFFSYRFESQKNARKLFFCCTNPSTWLQNHYALFITFVTWLGAVKHIQFLLDWQGSHWSTFMINLRVPLVGEQF